jgi:single-strand DNA-binding protein
MPINLISNYKRLQTSNIRIQVVKNRIRLGGGYNFAPSNLTITGQPEFRNSKKTYVMKNLRNQVQLIGRLGANVEMSELSTGTKKATMSVATSETYKNKSGENVTDTQWHNVIAWNATATYASNYLTKGIEVMVQGKLTNRSYVDKNGVTRYITEVVADQLLILQKKEEKRAE